jgi:hypothetical protein
MFNFIQIITYAVTGYRLDGPGIKSQWGRDFYTLPDQPWGPPSLLYNGYRVFPRVKRLRCGADHTPLSKNCGHQRVELYLYPLSGPVQVCNGTALWFFLLLVLILNTVLQILKI